MDTGLTNVALVVAVSENNVIGRWDDIPWKLSSDLRRFKDITTGHAVIMGRRTWESVNRRLGGPLPDRINAVVSHKLNYQARGALVYPSLREALTVYQGNRPVFVIGGTQVYEEAFAFASRIHITIVHTSIPIYGGEVFLPRFDLNRWEMTHFRRFPKDERNEHDYTFAIYERRPQQSFVYLSNAREPGQWSLMEKIFIAGVCPFCLDRLEQYHTGPIIRENQRWLLTENQTPYPNTRVHFLLIHRRHTENLAQLDAMDWQMLGSLVSWAEDKFEIAGGGLALRFGDPRVNGATVKHLHVHLLTAKVTDQSSPDYQPVRIRIG